MEVLQLIHSYQRPDLWRGVKDLMLNDGRLDVSGALTRDNFDALVYVLSAKVAAKDITRLEWVTCLSMCTSSQTTAHTSYAPVIII